MMLVGQQQETKLTPLPTPIDSAPTTPRVKPALLTGVLLWASHFPLAWGWLSWFALVPLLTLTRAQAKPRQIYWAAYLAGLTFFVPALQFMRVADWRMYFTWLMLAFYCAAYFPVGLWLIRWLDRRTVLPLCLSVPLVWVGLEWIRSFLLTGFAWYYLAHAQFRLTSLIQIADFGGVYAVSFLVAAVNGLLCDIAFRVTSWRERFHWQSLVPTSSLGISLQGATLIALLAAAVGYGHWRLGQDDFAFGPRIALLQTHIPQSARNDPRIGAQMELQNTALPYLACLSEPLVDLIVWPETSYMIQTPAGFLTHFVDVASELPLDKLKRDDIEEAVAMRNHFSQLLAPTFPTRHLLGINTKEINAEAKQTRYSSALLLQDDGSPTHRFDKIHRVPFGEYVPLRDWLPFMNALSPYDFDYSIAPGKKLTRFPIGDLNFGALVCFEDSDASLARQYSQSTSDGKPVDFLVNLSNDGWFHDTSEHEEHLVVSLFRAIESRRSLVRSVNMGISAIIDPNGRVLKPQIIPPERPDSSQPPRNPKLIHARKTWDALKLWPNLKLWERARPEETIATWEILPNREGKYDELSPSEYAEYKQSAGVLIGRVPIDRRVSVYSTWGDWLPMACWGLCFAAFFVSPKRQRG